MLAKTTPANNGLRSKSKETSQVGSERFVITSHIAWPFPFRERVVKNLGQTKSDNINLKMAITGVFSLVFYGMLKCEHI
jgi:hypothetical protein